MRINRFLARAGISSRRNAEEFIRAGKVSLNGKTVSDLATDVDPITDLVKVNGKVVILPKFRYYALNKPTGYTCTREDKHAAHTVYELLPDDASLFTVGRLDRETTGLILVTNDGNFAQNIIHPSKKVIKTYRVELQKPVTGLQIESLTKGLNLDDGPARAISARLINKMEIEIKIEEGRKRIVRRMIKAIGNDVVSLKRTQIGDISLDVEIGMYRKLTEKEISLYV